MCAHVISQVGDAVSAVWDEDDWYDAEVIAVSLVDGVTYDVRYDDDEEERYGVPASEVDCLIYIYIYINVYGDKILFMLTLLTPVRNNACVIKHAIDLQIIAQFCPVSIQL